MCVNIQVPTDFQCVWPEERGAIWADGVSKCRKMPTEAVKKQTAKKQKGGGFEFLFSKKHRRKADGASVLASEHAEAPRSHEW